MQRYLSRFHLHPQATMAFGWVTLFLIASTFWLAIAIPQRLAAQVEPSQSDPDATVAVVANQLIRRQELLNRIPQREKFWDQLSQSSRDELERTALQAVIDQRVVFDYLKAYKLTVSDSEIGLQLDALKAELEAIEKSLEDYLEDRQMTESELRLKIAFTESWKRYLDEKLTDENLKLHFERNRRRFDGTDIRVAHLLIKKSSTSEPAALRAKAEGILKQLKDGKLDWAQAVERYSEGTRENQGELGWVLLKPVMPKPVTEAAIKLNPGDFSEPVKTVYGIHLLHCLEVAQGKVDFGDAKARVKTDAKRFLFETISQKHRSEVKVENRLEAK